MNDGLSTPFEAGIPPLPDDEPARLAALHALRILDTPPEQRFDRITRLAQRLFGVSFALVSLVDARRQWFKSCQGLAVSETPREVSFCAHAILSEACMVVPDTLEDPRFMANPLVTGKPHLRFYAGQPVHTAAGYAIGTLCLADDRPRDWTAADARALRDFADMVESELAQSDMERALSAYAGAEQLRLRATQQAALRADVSTALSGSGSIEVILAQCLEAVVQRCQAAFARIWLLDPATDLLMYTAGAGAMPPQIARAAAVPVGALLVGHVAASREPYLTNDLATDPHAAPVRECLVEHGMVSFAGYPLVVDDEVIGVMGLFARQHLQPDTLETLASVADAIAQGLERRRALEALAQGEAKLRAIIDAASDAIFIKDREGRFILLNPAAAGFLGAPPGALRGKTAEEVFAPETARLVRAQDEHVMATRETLNQEQRRLRSAVGLETDYSITKHPYVASDGELLGIIGISRDITRQKHMEMRLQEQNERLQELDRLKGDLFNAVSHELRTPLTSILGYSEFLEEALETGSPQPLELLRPMRQSIARMQRLVDDLFDYARLEAGVFRLSITSGDVRQPIQHACESLRPLLHEHRLTLRLDLPDAPVEARMDGGRIEQVLLNLLTNAVKFTPPEGRIAVSLHEAADRLEIEVTDSGVGIPHEKLPLIFERFFQTDPDLRRARGGAGLGLAIAKGLVDAHGGTISAYSNLGQGATFRIVLPR